MNPERWERVKQLVGEAMTFEAAERSSFVDRICNGDSDLQREVWSLLSFHDQAGTDFLKESAVDLQPDTAFAQAPAGPPARAPASPTTTCGGGTSLRDRPRSWPI